MSATQADGSRIGRRDLAVLRLLYDTGMRRASVASLRRANVVEREGRIIVIYYGKGNKRHEGTLPEATAVALQHWMAFAADSPWVFPQDRDWTKHIALSTINLIVRYRSGGVVHPHQFRAAFITEALDALPLHEVQAAVGHADPRMTLRYDRRQRGGGVADAVAKSRTKVEEE
jgi:integrase